MSYIFRPLNAVTDFPGLAALQSSIYPDPVTAESLQHRADHAPEGIRSQTVVIDSSDQLVGWGDVGRWAYMRPGLFWINILVAPDCRGQGIGSQLVAGVIAFAQAQGATEVYTEVRDHDAESLRFAEQRGFCVDRHMFESVLDLATFDDSRFTGVVESLEAAGIRFFSMADVPDREENRRNLYELNKKGSEDIPGYDEPFPRFEDFNQFVFSGDWYRAEGEIVAADGERWIGMSAIGYFSKSNSCYNMHTGVLREYRGRHIALACKLLAIRLARRWNAAYIRTNNASINAPMLAINRKLGYTPEPGYYQVKKFLPVS